MRSKFSFASDDMAARAINRARAIIEENGGWAASVPQGMRDTLIADIAECLLRIANAAPRRVGGEGGGLGHSPSPSKIPA